MSNIVEVHGSAVMNIIDGCGVFKKRALSLLEGHGIREVEADLWYPLDTVISTINHLANSVGKNMVAEIGKYVPKNSPFPPDINSFDKAIFSLNQAYQMSHRNGKVGEYRIEQLDQKTFQIHCDTPYPSNFNMGLLRGLAKKFNALVRIEEINGEQGGIFMIKKLN